MPRTGDQAVASLCGLVERRLQEYNPDNEALAALRKIFGEALQQFSQEEEDDSGTPDPD